MPKAAADARESDTFRIALWNLERSTRKSSRLQEAQRSLVSGQRANLLLLMETHRTMSMDGFRGHFSAADTKESGYPEVEAAAGVFHDWDATPTAVPTVEKSHLATCLRFQTSPLGPLIVYCSIIPYHRWQVGPQVNTWQRHQESTERQVADWNRLLTDQEFLGYRLIVGGDFNQVLDGSSAYGSDCSRTLLDQAFSTGLECLTREDISASMGRHAVDHIAIDRRIAAEYSCSTTPWHARSDEPRLSDHNGVTVTLSRKS